MTSAHPTQVRVFFSEGFNIFDTFIVLASVCELILSHFQEADGSISALRASRTARAARATRALRATRAMRALRVIGHVEYLYVAVTVSCWVCHTRVTD